jgi:hypothetical protein
VNAACHFGPVHDFVLDEPVLVAYLVASQLCTRKIQACSLTEKRI